MTTDQRLLLIGFTAAFVLLRAHSWPKLFSPAPLLFASPDPRREESAMKDPRNIRIALVLLCSMLTAFVATPFPPDLPAVIVGAAASAGIFFAAIKMSRGCSPASWTAHRAETSHA